MDGHTSKSLTEQKSSGSQDIETLRICSRLCQII
jgi:hypothetical protein